MLLRVWLEAALSTGLALKVGKLLLTGEIPEGHADQKMKQLRGRLRQAA
jgi:hypothetical protein